MTSRIGRKDDTGAALVLALIFVTVVGLLVAALLSFSDASIRATVELRKQGSDTYAADGAAQVAINSLRNGVYTNAAGQSCFGGTATTLSLPNFPTSAAGSAFVECTTDATSGSGSPGDFNASNTPKSAILTLGTSTTEGGIDVGGDKDDDTVKVTGGVISNSSIRANPGRFESTTSIVAKTTSCTGTITAPIKTCTTATLEPDPAYPPPPAPPATPMGMPTCTTTGTVVFSPGLYNDALALSNCDKTGNTLLFSPGVYFFNFTVGATRTWTVNTGKLVGGTLPVIPDTTVPGTCVSPLTAPPPAQNLGVEFVFGGDGRMVVSGGARVELCGSYSTTSPPIAIYGLKSAVGVVPAQSGCISNVAPASPTCALLSSPHDQDLDVMVYVQGTVYAPPAWLDLSYGRNNLRGQFIASGIIARRVSFWIEDLDSWSGQSVAGAKVPTLSAPGPGAAETGVLLKVYVCPGASTCSAATGKLSLETKVGVSNPPTARTVKIYSWAVQR